MFSQSAVRPFGPTSTPILVIAAKSATLEGLGKSNPNLSHVRGLDSIRFVCALWVLFSHLGGFPLLSGINLNSFWGKAAKGLYGGFYNGPAAVIIFFVVSGFCIHYPHRKSERVQIPVFLARRYLRIGVPLVVAMLLGVWLNAPALLIQPGSLVIALHKVRMIEDSDVGVVWSLVCELIYYSIYPLLLLTIRKWGWKMTLGAAYVMALGIVLLRPNAHSYPAFGNLLTWILGLPCWLLGCRLAESLEKAEPDSISSRQIWSSRFIVWTVSAAVLFFRFHTPIGYPWTLTIFGILGFWWLRTEIIYHFAKAPWPALEWLGTWSYSIYLGHVLAQPFLSRMGIPTDFFALGPALNWFVKTLAVLIFCFGFYTLVELPSHLAARLVSRKLSVLSQNQRGGLCATQKL